MPPKPKSPAPPPAPPPPSAGPWQSRDWDKQAAQRREDRQRRLNPLSGITLPIVRDLLDRALHGDFPRLQWLYYYMERRYSHLGTVIERRESAAKKLKWKVTPKDTSAAAQAQAAEITALLAGVENLDEAISHFLLADFRGFSAAEIVTDAAGWPERIECFPHWNVRRSGMAGDWFFVPHDGAAGIPLIGNAYLFRTVARPVNEVALLEWIPSNIVKADFRSFTEYYGDPAMFFIDPPPGTLAAEDMAALDDLADETLAVKRGRLPHGTEIITPDSGTRDATIFETYFRIANENVILRGTGGLLTALQAAGGLGNAAANVQDDAFDDLVAATKGEVETLIQKGIIAPWISARFPGQSVMVDFSLGKDAKKDLGALANIVRTLTAAGLRPDRGWVEQTFEIKLAPEPSAPQPPAPPTAAAEPANVRNRAEGEADTTEEGTGPPDVSALLTESLQAAGQALGAEFAPLRERIQSVLEALGEVDGELTPALVSALEELQTAADAAAESGPSEALEDVFASIDATALLMGWEASQTNE